MDLLKYSSSNSYKEKRKKSFKIDSDLGISKFILEYLNYFPVNFIGSHKQIDEIIQVFTEYYGKRIPSKKREMKEILTYFGEMLKLSEGKLKNLKEKLILRR